jgi:hypothetical protein
MNSKEISLIIVFAAISVSLHPTISGLAIPSFAIGRWFQFWEIPIFAVLILFGLKYAAIIAALDTITLIVLFGSGPFTHWFNIIPFSGTLLGVFLVHRLLSRKSSIEEVISKRKEIIFSIISGISFRFLIGFPAFYLLLKYLGQLPDPVIFTMMFFYGIHDVILVSYSIPISYYLAGLIRKHLIMDLKSNI